MAGKRDLSKVILEAAYQCISEHGYANVTTRDIADKAGVVLSQLTYYYQSKRNLFAAVIRTMLDRYLGAVREAIEGIVLEGIALEDVVLDPPDPGTPAPAIPTPAGPSKGRERLRALGASITRLIARDPALNRLFVDFIGQSMWQAEYASQLRDFFGELRALMAPLLPGVDEEDARLIVGSMYGISVQRLLDNPFL